MQKTYLFYDTETTGLNKAFDQIIQFAAIRTDMQLNELERHEFFVKLNCDVIPSPKAFMTHRVPLSKLAHGITECAALQKIHQLFNTPGTISIGYNSLGFDDEFLRFSFYRNLLPPYTHQYLNQCSRMDLYPMAVMYFLFKPQSLTWPEDNLKLENISRLNSLQSGIAHNAMVDVLATLELAKCFHQDTKTWHYLTGFFNKQIDAERCQQAIDAEHGYALMIEGKLGIKQQYQSAVFPLGYHHHYKNQFVFLRIDREENLAEPIIYNKKLGEPAWIMPARERFLQPFLAEKQTHLHEQVVMLKKSETLLELSNYHLNFTFPKIASLDACASLYDNGFLNVHDQALCKSIHTAEPREITSFINGFSQNSLKDIAIRMIGRTYPDLLNADQRKIFDEYVNNIWTKKGNELPLDYRGKARRSAQDALLEIEELKKTTLNNDQISILYELKSYIESNSQMVEGEIEECKFSDKTTSSTISN